MNDLVMPETKAPTSIPDRPQAPRAGGGLASVSDSEPQVKVHPFIKVIARALAEAASHRPADEPVGQLANASFQGSGERLGTGLGVRDRRHQSVLRHDILGDDSGSMTTMKLVYGSRMLAGTALRMLIPRIKLLHEQLLIFRRAGKLDAVVKRVRDNHLQYKMALFFLLDSEEFSAQADRFRHLIGELPEDIEVLSMHTDELIDSYLGALQAVVSEFSQADQDFLDTLSNYGNALVAERQHQKRSFLEAERDKLSGRFEELMESLDGSKLHRERETLRRDLESAKVELVAAGGGQAGSVDDSDEEVAGLKTLLRAFSFGRRNESDDRGAATRREGGGRALLARISELEKRFKALERVKDKLIASRDELREQLSDIEAALASTGESDVLQSAHEGLVQARVMGKMQERQQSFERLRLVCAPLQAFRDAHSNGDAKTQSSANCIAQAVRGLEMVTTSSSMYQEIFELIQKLLAVYWANPARALSVFQYEARGVRELTRPGAPHTSQGMDDWYAEMKDHATSDDESLKQFLTTLRITVPEEIKRHVEAEFHFVYSPQRERGY